MNYNYNGEYNMAKRKKRKESNSGLSLSVEITGLIFILIGIIGMGFGEVGNIIKKFAMFLAGEFWYVILFLITASLIFRAVCFLTLLHHA